MTITEPIQAAIPHQAPTRAKPLAPLVFADTETTSAAFPGRRLWEIALIKRLPNGQTRHKTWIIRDVDLREADRQALAMNHFYERHPEHGGKPGGADVTDEATAAREIAEWLRPQLATSLVDPGALDFNQPIVREDHALVYPWLLGHVPGFDEYSLRDMLHRHGLPYGAHYQPIDTTAILVGWLAGVRTAHYDTTGQNALRASAEVQRRLLDLQPPWDINALTGYLGIPPLPAHEKHTAMGDARRVMEIWDALMGSNQPHPRHNGDQLAQHTPATS